MLNLNATPLSSNVQITPVSSSSLVSAVVYLNSSESLCYLTGRKANIPFFANCFTNFASTAFVVALTCAEF